jgi:transposase
MARPRRIDEASVRHARHALKNAQTVDQLRCAQAILLPALHGHSLEQVAAVLGVGRATVARMQARFRRRVASPDQPRRWGGRRRSLLSMEQEKRFLEPWLERALRGEVLVVSPLRAALAQKLGRPVAASVVYQMLARHGWRKLAPDTRHPQSDPQLQEEWKKNSRKRWRA